MKITYLNHQRLNKMNRSILITSSIYTLTGIITLTEEISLKTVSLTILGSIFVYDSLNTLININKRKKLLRLK